MSSFPKQFKSIAGLLLLSAIVVFPSLAAAQDANQGRDKESLGQFINADAGDTNTKLEVIQQELYQAEQEAILVGFTQEYGSRIHLKRVLYASGAELIPGYTFTPANMPQGKRYPALILLHGGFHEKLDWRFFRYIDGAVSRGFVVFFPEYRGSRGYGENHYQNDYGITDLEDVLAGTEYLSRQEFVDANRLGIIGHSRGGMLTMRAIEKEPKRFKAAVEIAGLADFLAYMSYKPEYRRNEVAKEKYFQGKLPSENLQPYLDISPLNHVDDIQTPLFIMGTTADNEVPFSLHGARIADAMKARGKIFETKVYDKAPGGHVFLFGDTAEANDCETQALDFLSKYLKP
jgi:dipeptidyl aminopeptidase/acylaminoacyl peptidase